MKIPCLLIASNTKLFTATALAQLEADKKDLAG